MERRWAMKNVDLYTLTMRMGDFFKDRNFEVLGEKTPTNYQVTAGNSPSFKLLGVATVTIEGEPNDFFIKLELVEKKRRYSKLGTFFLNLFGGGYLVLRETKSEEAWMKLEKEFWPFVENLVLNLTNSAASSKQ